MKGGYQILDLTGATSGDPVEVKGIYKAASSNNGKPVMILTNDGQRVYAEIAEDDGDYVTCYISAEGKTVKVTITDEDSVTTVIEDDTASIAALTEELNDLTSPTIYQYDSSVEGGGVNLNVATYTQASPFTAPKRGYLTVISGNTDPILVSNPIGNSYYSIIGVAATTSANETWITFPVEKGQKLFVNNAPISGNAVARYMPY